MTCSNQQVKLFMKYIKQNTQIIAAARAGMDVKTARKYLKANQSSDEVKQPRSYSTRIDPFVNHWTQLEQMLTDAPELQANTLLAYLIEQYPSHYNDKHLRSMQRRIQQWRAEYGKDKSVIFRQNIKPGIQSQSDWTNMNSLNITINNQFFPHLLFHFMLPYSGWETVMLCYSESFETLTLGFERAVWELGETLIEHRTAST